MIIKIQEKLQYNTYTISGPIQANLWSQFHWAYSYWWLQIADF